MSLQDSRVIETVKVLLKVGADGRGIASVEKTGTSGDVDTYTITLTDQTKYTFDVTNGASIDTIEKTGTSGAVDTYTITLTNGETFTFTVTNGVGTIASDIGYDNTSSGLTADDVQEAIDEEQTEINAIKNPTFTEAQTRANIASGESLATLFGKIKKFFTDLKTVAFSGSYSDLSNKPDLPSFTIEQTSITTNQNSGWTDFPYVGHISLYVIDGFKGGSIVGVTATDPNNPRVLTQVIDIRGNSVTVDVYAKSSQTVYVNILYIREG